MPSPGSQIGLRNSRMSSKSCKLSIMDRESDGVGVRQALEGRETEECEKMWHPALILTLPRPQENPHQAALALFMYQSCAGRHNRLPYSLRCPRLLQGLRSPWAMPGILDFSFHSFACCVASADKPVPFVFLPSHVHLGRCQGVWARPGVGGRDEFWPLL